MYVGVKSYKDALSCHDYETARRSLERASRPPELKRLREPKRFGYHLGMGRNHGVTWVREEDDGAIVFRLYETDVVIWHPDNSVEIENYGTVTTGGFARKFLPSGISLCHPTTHRGELAGHKGISYCVERPEYDRRFYGSYNLCFGDLVRFRQHGDNWLPDEDTLDTIRFPEVVDRKAQRDVSKKYHLRDFETWLSMAPMHMAYRIEHDCWDVDDCAAALLKRDFTLASTFLPLTHDSGAYRNELKIIPIATNYRDQHVTVAAIDKLKLALWDLEGLIETVEFTTISSAEFERRMRRVKQMEQLGLCSYDLGPPR